MEKTILIDTHKCFKILERAKMDKVQAEAIIEVMSDGISADKLVTKDFLEAAMAKQTVKLTAIMVGIVFGVNGLFFALLRLTA